MNRQILLEKLKKRRTQVIIAFVLLTGLLVVASRDDYEVVQLIESSPLNAYDGALEFRFPQALGTRSALFQSSREFSGLVRGVDQQFERVSEEGHSLGLRPAYALVGETIYYVNSSARGELCAVDKGVVRTVAKHTDKIPKNFIFGGCWTLDSDGKTLALKSDYSPDILTVQDGRVAVLLHVEKGDGSSTVKQICVDGEFVYILRRGFSNEIVRGKGAEIQQLIRAGDQVADGTIDSLFGVCAVDGKVAVNAVLKVDGEYRHVILWYDGAKPEVIWRQTQQGSRRLDDAEFVCTNGHSVAFIEATTETVEIKPPRVGFAPRRAHLTRLFISRGTSSHKVVEVGDEFSGSTLVQIGLGPRSMDLDGNVAFSYKLADDRSGVAIARLKD